MHVRRAREDEAALLSGLAFRSKAVWGYSAAFMERCRPILTLSPDHVRARPVYVAEEGDAVLGFYSLHPRRDDPAGELELDLLFVEPHAIGRGAGRLLLRHALRTAAALGRPRLIVESDPGAEPFYVRHGARRIGTVASTVEPGRELPLLAFELAESAAAPAGG